MQPQDPEQWRQPAETSPQITYSSPVNQTPPQPMQMPPQPQIVQEMPPTQPVTAQEQLDAPGEAYTPSGVDDAILLRWQATEYIQHDRSAIWYGVSALVVLSLILLAIFVIKSVTFAILLPVMAVALFVYVRRQPAVLNYILSKKGLYVNDKLYSYDLFRAFGVATLAGHHTVQLIPRKRFQIGQAVYFPEEVGEVLVDMLAARLPMQDVHPDLYDRIIVKLKM